MGVHVGPDDGKSWPRASPIAQSEPDKFRFRGTTLHELWNLAQYLFQEFARTDTATQRRNPWQRGVVRPLVAQRHTA